MDAPQLNAILGKIGAGLLLLHPVIFILSGCRVFFNSKTEIPPEYIRILGEEKVAGFFQKPISAKVASFIMDVFFVVVLTWFLLWDKCALIHDSIAAFTTYPPFQALLFALALALFYGLWLLCRTFLVEKSLKNFFQKTLLSGALADRRALIVITVMLGLVFFGAWLFWRFPDTSLFTLLFLFLWVLFRRTNWYRERRLRKTAKRDSLGNQEERHQLVSAWLSRVGSGITELRFIAGGSGVGAVVRGSGGNKTMLVKLSRIEPESSDRIILACALALAENNSPLRNRRSFILIFTAAVAVVIYGWGILTNAIPLAFGITAPDYFITHLLTLYPVFMVYNTLVQWLTFPVLQKMYAASDTFVLTHCDLYVQEELKKHIENELKIFDERLLIRERNWFMPGVHHALLLRLRRITEFMQKNQRT